MTYYRNQFRVDKNDKLFLPDETDAYSGCVIVPNGVTLCDRFVIKKLINTTNHRSVYLAEDILKKIDVIIKTADIESYDQKIPGMMLELEIDTYKNLFSPYIIRVYDSHYAHIGGTSLLVLSMEYIDGQIFRQWLSECTNDNLRREKGLEWFKKICMGIGEAHDINIIHLNINPKNILVKDNQLKISGFETSNNVRINLANKRLNMDSISKETNPVYMSPELFNTPHPDELTPAADVYSLGILLYELFHPKSRPPFTGSYSSLRDFHLNVPFKKIETLDNKLSDIISRCLKKNPKERYQTAWELLDALENNPSDKTLKIEESNRLAQENFDIKFQEIILNYEKKNFNKTTRLIDEILIQDPEHETILQLQARLNKKYHQAEQFYNEINKELESEKKSLKQLLELFKQAMNIYPDHPSGAIVQYKLLNLSKLYRTSMENGYEAVQNQNLQGALYLFEQAHMIETGSNTLKEKIEHLKKIKQMKDEIDENIAQGDFVKARRIAYLTDLFISAIKNPNT